MYLFSIILPTYNRAVFLPKAIESVINQTHNHWELIIVDDGSTDNTKKIVEPFLQSDKRIKYIYQKNAERSVARNNGIQNAKGSFICFLDSDDYYHEKHLQKFQTLILDNKNQAAIYFSGMSYNSFSTKKERYKTAVKNNIEFIFLNSIGTPRACIHKNCLKENKFNPLLNIGEDKDLWLRITATFPVYYHHEKTFIAVEHDGRSVLGASCYSNLNTIKKILEYDFVKKNVSKKIKKTVLSNTFFNIAKYELQSKNRIKSVTYFIKSIVVLPKHKQSKLKLNCILKLVLGADLNHVLNLCV